MAGFVRVIWVCREAVYFLNREWTGQITLKLLEKIDLQEKSILRAPTVCPTVKMTGRAAVAALAR
jgi:hypothetical protein